MSSPARGGWRGAWSNKDTSASAGPPLTTAQCPGQPPECHPSCAAAPQLYRRDSRSSPGRACVWPRPPHAASLRGGNAARVDAEPRARSPPRGSAMLREGGSHRVCSSASPSSGR